METIASFLVDHTTLMPGIYYSRQDRFDGADITTFDLRVTRPNVEPALSTTDMHSIEHMFATYLRNHYDDIVYFGPMGCRTGFYLITSGRPSIEAIRDRVLAACRWTLSYPDTEPIPGQSAKECGNYRDLCLADAKRVAERMESAYRSRE